jgi:hypothetical protein
MYCIVWKDIPLEIEKVQIYFLPKDSTQQSSQAAGGNETTLSRFRDVYLL